LLSLIAGEVVLSLRCSLTPVLYREFTDDLCVLSVCSIVDLLMVSSVHSCFYVTHVYPRLNLLLSQITVIDLINVLSGDASL